MTTTVTTGPLRWCRCGHGEHEHRSWLIECSACDCAAYRRDRSRRARTVDGTPDPLDAVEENL